MKQLLTATLLAISLPAGAVGLITPADPEALGLSPQRLDAARQLLQDHVDNGEIAGAIGLVARHGKLAYEAVAGVRDRRTGEAMSADTVFRIFSMAKPITAAAAMQLVERGELDLSKPVSHYLPEFADVRVAVDKLAPATSATRAPTRELVVEDLLLHTDGLSHRWSDQYQARRVHSRHYDLARVARNVAVAPLMEDPGTYWRYGIGPTVLARIVEVVSGEVYADYLSKHLFTPLGMSSAGYMIDEAESGRLAALYRSRRSGPAVHQPEDPSLPYTKMPRLHEGASNMLTSATDYLRFGQMLLNGGELDGHRVLKAETVNLMASNHLPESVLPMVIQDNVYHGHGWGYGMGVITDPDLATVTGTQGEITWGGAAGTRFWVDRENDMVIVLMLQILPHDAYAIGDRFRTAVAEALLP